jgi:outer membrane protein assembly factor BamB
MKRNFNFIKRLNIPFCLLAGFACSVANAEWPGWRGPNQSGSISSGEFPTQWSAEDAAWKVKLPGKGGSTPIVLNDTIFLTTPIGDENGVMAFDMTGKELWRKTLGKMSPAKHQKLGSSCNSSPVSDGDGLFVYFRSGQFAALELDGSIRWQQDLNDQFGPENLFWDQGSSPVVTDKHVILTRMHAGDSWVAGFNKKSGKVEWKTDRNYSVPSENDNGYSTPVLFEYDGAQALLVWGADHLTAYDATNGKLLWSAGGFNPDGTGYWPAISSPVVHDGLAIVPVGRDDRPRQSSMAAVKLDGSGDVSKSHRVWDRDDVGVFVPALAEYDGRIYLLRNRGGVACLDPKTGQTIWEDELPRTSASYYSSPVIANGVLYAARQDGTVFAAKVGDKFELLGENDMGEPIIASPVPVKNRLLIRGDDHLFCIAAE